MWLQLVLLNSWGFTMSYWHDLFPFSPSGPAGTGSRLVSKLTQCWAWTSGSPVQRFSCGKTNKFVQKPFLKQPWSHLSDWLQKNNEKQSEVGIRTRGPACPHRAHRCLGWCRTVSSVYPKSCSQHSCRTVRKNTVMKMFAPLREKCKTSKSQSKPDITASGIC